MLDFANSKNAKAASEEIADDILNEKFSSWREKTRTLGKTRTRVWGREHCPYNGGVRITEVQFILIFGSFGPIELSVIERCPYYRAVRKGEVQLYFHGSTSYPSRG